MGDPPHLSTSRPTQLAGKWAVLDLEFVDTIADVTVNGKVVATLDSSASSATAST